MKCGWKSMVCFLFVLGVAAAARADVIVPYRPDSSDVRGLGWLGLLFCGQLLLSGACFLVLARKEPDRKAFGVVAALLAVASAAPWVAAGTPFWIPLGLASLVAWIGWLLVSRFADGREAGKRVGGLAVVLLLFAVVGEEVVFGGMKRIVDVGERFVVWESIALGLALACFLLALRHWRKGGWMPVCLVLTMLLLGIAGDGAYVNSEFHRAAEEFDRQQRIDRPHKYPYWEDDISGGGAFGGEQVQ